MHLSDAAWALLLLPAAGVGASYLAETRRGAALAVLASAWLTVVAGLVVLGVTVARFPVVHQSTLTFWTFSVTQSPFNAARPTLLAPTFQVGVGYSLTPVAASLAMVVAVAVLLGQIQMMGQLRSDGRLAGLMRLTGLISFAALALIMAPGLFQVVIGFELCGLLAALLIGSSLGAHAGSVARRTYLVWRGGGLALLLAVAFIYVKFSGPIEVAATSSRHPAAVVPDGLNLTALSSIWAAAARGQVHGVGGRTLTLAAVLIVVAAVAACGQLPLQGLWRGLGDAPEAAAPILLGVVGLAVGSSVLAQTYPLLQVASGVLPALVVLAAVTGLATAVVALRQSRLNHLAAYVAASLSSAVLVGFGLGSPGAAVTLAASAVLTIAALGAVSSHLGRDLRVDTVAKLGPGWRQARPAVVLLVVALAAAAGAVGAGTFFPRAAVLGAAFGGVGVGLPAVRPLLAVVGGGGELLASVLLAAVGARVALAAIRGADAADPREARATRRHLSQTRPAGQLPVLRAGVLVAVLSGLLSLPAIHLGLGSFLALHKGRTVLPIEPWALVLTLVAPLAGAAGGWAWFTRRTSASSVGGGWAAWLDGGPLISATERTLLGWPSRAVDFLTTEVWAPLSAAAAGTLEQIAQVAEGERPWWPIWSGRSGAAALTVLALAVAVVAFVGTAHPGGVGLP